MTSPEPVNQALRTFSNLLDRMEKPVAVKKHEDDPSLKRKILGSFRIIILAMLIVLLSIDILGIYLGLILSNTIPGPGLLQTFEARSLWPDQAAYVQNGEGKPAKWSR